MKPQVRSHKSQVILACIIMVLLFAGCASVKEAAKGFAGVSTKTLEQHRSSATVETFAMDHDVCYGRIKSALGAMGAYIYAQDVAQTMIAVYVSEQDTTPVGIFLKSVDPAHTQIEVSSPSSNARDAIAEKLFAALGQPSLAPRLQERTVQADAPGP